MCIVLLGLDVSGWTSPSLRRRVEGNVRREFKDGTGRTGEKGREPEVKSAPWPGTGLKLDLHGLRPALRSFGNHCELQKLQK